jgi:competence protein ComEA
MASHRRDDLDDEPVALRRLARALGTAGPGWTPTRPGAVADVAADVAADGADDESRRRPVRVAAHPSALTWLLLTGLAVLLVSGYLLSRHHAGTAVPTAAAPAPLAAAASPTAATIVVDVGGRVRHPGLVTLPVGARVADAIAAAGGALRPADIATIDLAAHVTDGQLLLIGVPGAAGTGSAAAPGVGGGPVDLNRATVEQLDALPGVGPVLAARIVAWREAHGGFRSVEDLQQVPGIGARKFADLKSLVSA